MAFKLTYTDGQDQDFDDSTKWEVEAGVLKMGREPGNWTVLISPSHWATIEMAPAQDKDKAQDKENDKDKDKDSDDSGNDDS